MWLYVLRRVRCGEERGTVAQEVFRKWSYENPIEDALDDWGVCKVRAVALRGVRKVNLNSEQKRNLDPRQNLTHRGLAFLSRCEMVTLHQQSLPKGL